MGGMRDLVHSRCWTLGLPTNKHQLLEHSSSESLHSKLHFYFLILTTPPLYLFNQSWSFPARIKPNKTMTNLMRCLSANPHAASKDYWKTKTQLQAAIKGIHPVYSLFAGHLSMPKPELGTGHRYSSPHSGSIHNIPPVSTARRAKISLQAEFWEHLSTIYIFQFCF